MARPRISSAACCALMLSLLLGVSPARADIIVYSADFETPVGSEWSNTSRSTTPGTAAHPADRFLGEFGNGTVSLTLSNLAPHTQVTLAFDLFVIRTWDGNGFGVDGPDNFDVKVTGGPTLLNTNFGNSPDAVHRQAYPNMLPPDGLGGTFPLGTGAAEINTLGFFFSGNPADSVYRFNLSFTSSASTLVLNFHGAPNEVITNESWGLNNVLVSINAVNAVPEPASLAVFGVLAAVGVGVVRRRRTVA